METKKKRTRRAKHTTAFIKEYFEKAGCKLLTTPYTGSKQELHYICHCGQKGVTCYNNFSRGEHRCMSCFMKGAEAKAMARLTKALVFKDDLYDMSDAARFLGVHYGDFYREVRTTKRIPSPSRPMTGKIKLYYNKADLEKIRELLA